MINLSLDFPVGHGFSPQAWRPSKASSTSHIPTTNGFFLRSSVLSNGNFSSQFPYAGEDLNMGKRLKKQGGKLFLFPKPLVVNNYAFSYAESLKRLFSFGLIQSKNKSLLFYFSLIYFPLFIGSGVLSFINLMFSLSQSSFTLSFALIFLVSYFLLLLSYSLKACIKVKKLSPILLVFFWLLQHLSYSSGVFFGFIFRRKGF